jgi:imidazoleglycerol-phosphate dehydratase
MTRKGKALRKTREVEIEVSVDLDGGGEYEGTSSSAFVDHMMRTLCKHGRMDVRVKVKGDLKHHIIEDLALVLGKALSDALGDKSGIGRFGYAYVAMDDSLARSVVDLGGRAYSRINLGLKGESIEDTRVEDLVHFLESLVQSLQFNLHLKVIYGSNDHHRIEAAIKALALSIRMATSPSGAGGIPSAKGEI